MMRDLFLLRHAEAAEKTGTQRDFDRPLTESGIRQATGVGVFLKKEKVIPHVIIASPAVRTWQTACIAASHIGYPEEEILADKNIYQASLSKLVNVLRQLHPDFLRVLLVAHNPAVSYLAEWLTKQPDTALSTGALLHVQLHMQSWQELREGSGKLLRDFRP
jgi:phosphohistidine phosphatase